MLSLCPLLSYGQYDLRKFYLEGKNQRRVVIPFEMVHNLIIIPGFINESDTLYFILDTGVTSNLLTSVEDSDSLRLKATRKISLTGLGEGEVLNAIHSYGNYMRIPGIHASNHDIIIPEFDLFNLSQSLGRQINGIIGYDIFNSFVVEIRYSQKRLILYERHHYDRKIRKRRLRRGDVVPIELISRKPYVQVYIKDENNEPFQINLLVDSGASHALSLFSSTDDRLAVRGKSIRSFLGLGLGGEIHGELSRLPSLEIGDFGFENLVASYPDSSAIQFALKTENRHGSIGADILKRFNVVFDYKNREMILRPNRGYKKKFIYNMSGLEITNPIPGLPLYKVARVRQGSPAYEAGIVEGDQIISINGNSVSHFELSNIIEILHSRPGRKIKISVMRDAYLMRANLTLEDNL
ncbi:MAG: aspartyl protease family protein [Cyclobacteriaceae bacterium]